SSGEPPDERRRATLKLFRFMSDFREAMWGVVQTGVSELDFDFREYAQKHFDRLEKAGGDSRFEGGIEGAREGGPPPRSAPAPGAGGSGGGGGAEGPSRPPSPSSAGRTWCCSSGTSSL